MNKKTASVTAAALTAGLLYFAPSPETVLPPNIPPPPPPLHWDGEAWRIDLPAPAAPFYHIEASYGPGAPWRVASPLLPAGIAPSAWPLPDHPVCGLFRLVGITP